MCIIYVEIDSKTRKNLGIIASIKGKEIEEIINDLIDDYIKKNKKRMSKGEDIKDIMKMSEKSFMEWDNNKDDVYTKM